MGPQKWKSWWPVGDAGGGPKGMVEGGLKGDNPSEALVVAAGKTHP